MGFNSNGNELMAMRFCKFCESDKPLQKRGIVVNISGKVQRYHCNSCGKNTTELIKESVGK